MRLFSTVLGGSASSRLNRALRDRLGLTYHTRSLLDPLTDVGALLVLFASGHAAVPQVLRTVRETIDGMLEAGVTQAELSRARAMTRGIYAREREDSAVHARLLGLELFRRKRLTSSAGEAELLASISAEEVLTVARTVLRPDDGRCILVGPQSDDGLPTVGQYPWQTATPLAAPFG